MKKLSLCLAIASLSSIAAADTNLDGLVADSKTQVDFRYRFEGVDQQGFDEQAAANTLRSRINFTSGTVSGTSFTLEFSDVRALGDEEFNSTANGQAQYPVVADPAGTDLNQALIKYNYKEMSAIAGRQRINLDDQRFIGGVGWRQNEQTFDGGRLEFSNDTLSANYSYITQVNRIFGPEGNSATLEGEVHLVNGSWKIAQGQQLIGFVYNMDFDIGKGEAFSNSTKGVRYQGEFNVAKVIASYAQQSDTGNNPIGYSADYGLIEASGNANELFGWKVGYEVLGSDSGTKAFMTPLATLHKFQGFADKFLNTPAVGIHDSYIGANVKLGPVKLGIDYHQFKADEGNASLGSEIDLTAAYTINKNIKTLLKIADFQADDFSVDTKKIWFMVDIAL